MEDVNISMPGPSPKRSTMRAQNLEQAFRRLDEINSGGLNRNRLAALAGTTETYVEQWQTARAIAPLKGAQILATTLTNLRRRKKDLETELARVNLEINRSLNANPDPGSSRVKETSDG